MIDDANVWHGLLPKIETQAFAFQQKYPEYDGRGVIVGILDTGVDPGAIGLQTTSHGLPKVIDIIDCSGSGDVLMGPFITPIDNKITTVDGRLLTINPNWKNPTGQYRVGIKRAFELYPRGLKDRVLEERKKSFQKIQNETELSLQKKLLIATGDENIENIKAEIALLKSFEKELEDPGPIYDCLTWYDGEIWQAVINTSQQDNEMCHCIPMSDYHIKRQYQRFSSIDALNYCVNIYDQGTILSICVDAGAHGSHVAGIVSCYHSTSPELNGVAPGAQIISLKIGDSRLGSMETGVSLTRALIEAKKRGCHIINMSYGEGTAWDNKGYFIKLAEDLVINHNIVFVASAGNNGPALSTVGAPGGTSSAIISVSAYVTQNMMSASHTLLENIPNTNYTWSSMGPCIDGDLGVNIMAPGAAITSVPSWTLQKNQLMNGTSMSSPNACGCVTLLLSAAFANNLNPSTSIIKRAIQNSAKLCENVHILGQGCGLIQVEKAWKTLQMLTTAATAVTDKLVPVPAPVPVHYKVSLLNDRFKRGIYLRGEIETSKKDNYRVQIEAIFRKQDTVDDKINFEIRLQLETTTSWIQSPPLLLLAKSEKIINISVDPSKLLPGVHVGFINVYEENQLEKGILFRIPVTVTKPDIIPKYVTDVDLGQISFATESRFRRFFIPPSGSSFVNILVKDSRDAINKEGDVDCDDSAVEDVSSRIVGVHAVQLFSGKAYRDHEKQAYITLTPGSIQAVTFSLESDSIPFEICLARSWSGYLKTCCSVTLQFKGITPLSKQIFISGGDRVSQPIQLFAELSTVSIQPCVKLEYWKLVIKPTSTGKVLPLGDRDFLVDGTPLYQLILEYNFEQSETFETVTIWPGLQGVLYESEFHSQFFMIFDSKKKILFYGDAWPKKNKISKGKYTVRLQVRHEKIAILEKLVDMPMILQRTMKVPITLNTYKTQSDALMSNESESFGSRTLSIGTSALFYCKEPILDQLPKGVKSGDQIIGNVTYLKKNGNNNSTTTLGASVKPNGYPVIYEVFDLNIDTANNKKDSAETEAVDDQLQNAIKDAKIKFVKNCIGKTSFEDIHATISTEYPDNIALKVHRIQHYKKKLETENEKISDEIKNKTIKSCLDAIEDVIAVIDADELAKAYGVLLPLAGKENEEKKNALVLAYTMKCKILLETLLLKQQQQQQQQQQRGQQSAELISSTAPPSLLSVGSTQDVVVPAVTAFKDATAPITTFEDATAPITTIEDATAPTTTIEDATAPTTTSTVSADATDATDAVTSGATPGMDTASLMASVSTLAEYLLVEKQLEKWADLNTDKYWHLVYSKNKLQNKNGLALKKAFEILGSVAEGKVIPDTSYEKVLQECLLCLDTQGWAHIREVYYNWAKVATKTDFDPF